MHGATHRHLQLGQQAPARLVGAGLGDEALVQRALKDPKILKRLQPAPASGSSKGRVCARASLTDAFQPRQARVQLARIASAACQAAAHSLGFPLPALLAAVHRLLLRDEPHGQLRHVQLGGDLLGYVWWHRAARGRRRVRA